MSPTAGAQGYKYDVALSFAREDAPYVTRVAAGLGEAGVRVFFHDQVQAHLVGEDLAIELSEIYAASQLVVAFVSEHYVRRPWTLLEFQSALAGEMDGRRRMIVPARFDDTPLRGLLSTRGYVDLRVTAPEALVGMLIEKLASADDAESVGGAESDAPGGTAVPLDASGPYEEPAEFFFPLTLGRRRPPEPARPDAQKGASAPERAPGVVEPDVPAVLPTAPSPTPAVPPTRAPRAQLDDWHEGVRDERAEARAFDSEVREREVFDALRRQASASARGDFWVVLGEPGAGKSTLLERWFARWGAALDAAGGGGGRRAASALVRLRELSEADRDLAGDALVERLWRAGCEEAVRLPSRVRDAVYRPGGWRTRPLVWLLDGLDELHNELRGAATLRRLANLPGLVVLSCRTAIYETMRAEASGYAARDREYQIRGLTPEEQRAFLIGLLADEERAATVQAALARHAALRPLASNPLMLGLLTQVSSPEELPATRAEFYAYAASAMWSRKVGDETDQLELIECRDTTLCAVAESLGMGEVEGALPTLLRCARAAVPRDGLGPTLVDSLTRSGLLRLDVRRERFGFLHKTFQEYYLARALEPAGLLPALQRWWRDERYEETLSLLTSVLVAAGRTDDVERAIRWLVASDGEAATSPVTKGGPPQLRQVGAAPAWRRGPDAARPAPHVPGAESVQTGRTRTWPGLRVALRLLARAGAPLLDTGLTGLLDFLWERLRGTTAEFVCSVADDERTPPAVLLRMAWARRVDVQELVARNPSSPAEALATLATATDDNVRCEVARNPSASADVLMMMALDPAASVRRAVAENPTTPVSLLEQLVSDDEGAAAVVGRNPNAPVWLLERIVTMPDREAHIAVVRNPAAPVELLDALAQSDDTDVLVAIAESARATPDILARLADAGAESSRLRVEVAENAAAPPALLATLAGDEESSVREAAAGNPRTPPDALVRLYADAEPAVRQRLVWNPGTPMAVLDAMATDADPEVRGRLASNPATPADLLDRLVSDTNDAVRAAVVQNPSAPHRALERLVTDPQVAVRRALARAPGTRGTLLVRLARDADAQVRREVARHPSAPAEALVSLASDPDGTHEAIRLDVVGNPHASPLLLARLTRDPSRAVRQAVARDLRTPPPALLALARDGDVVVREAVARNTAAPAESLRALAAASEARVRAAVASHGATPADVLGALAADASAEVRRGVASNAAAPAEALGRLAADSISAVRTAVARNQATPAEVLAALAADSTIGVRAAVARNPGMSPEGMALLLDDPSDSVRYALMENPNAGREALSLLDAF